ncbi:unnamed protein product [Protopolystoma xenopodis]|uniref:Uncharacterized protein n=1 Tax=Protopolystoma xenopodis TaxID=117903 RepID=A0A3S5BLH5_9PLAT|nr:unnamed protein product [Protopolystoma xenopodis]
MEYDSEWAERVKMEKFPWHNNQWIEAIQSADNGISSMPKGLPYKKNPGYGADVDFLDFQLQEVDGDEDDEDDKGILIDS